jgi:hypothetical protein
LRCAGIAVSFFVLFGAWRTSSLLRIDLASVRPLFMNFPSFHCRQRQAAISAARNRRTARKVVMPDSQLKIIRVFGPQMIPKVIVRRPTGQFDAKGAHEGERRQLEDRWMAWMGRRRSVGHVALQPMGLLPRRLLKKANIDRQNNVA